jgi:hypothetical protein
MSTDWRSVPCKEWTGWRADNGYGMRTVNGKRTTAHRHAYEEAYGSIPDGLFALHHCDNPPCVEPLHLFLGTQKDNMRDMMEKGRRGGATHCKNGHEYTSENSYLYIDKRGKRSRICRACRRARSRKKYANMDAATKERVREINHAAKLRYRERKKRERLARAMPVFAGDEPL